MSIVAFGEAEKPPLEFVIEGNEALIFLGHSVGLHTLREDKRLTLDQWRHNHHLAS